MRFLSNKIRDQFRPDIFRLDPDHSLSVGNQLFLGGLHAGGLTAFDSGVYQRNGTLGLAADLPTWTPAENRYSLDLDSVGDRRRVKMPFDIGVEITYPISFSIWVKRSVNANNDNIFNQSTTNGGYDFTLHTRTDGLRCRTGYSGAEGPYFFWSFTPTLTWTHLLLYVPSTDLPPELWVNGVQLSRSNTATTVSTDSVYFDVGRTAGNTFQGAVSDFGMWNRQPALSEIQLLASSDPTYGGWIQPVTRRIWPVSGGAPPPASIIPRIMRHRKLMGVS